LRFIFITAGHPTGAMRVATVISSQWWKRTLSAFASNPLTRRSTLKRHSSGFIIGIVVSLVLGFGIVAGIALGLQSAHGLGYEPSSVLKATPTGPNSATLSFSTFPDSLVCHPGADAQQSAWVSYCPTTSFQVPPNSLITVVINQYERDQRGCARTHLHDSITT